MAVSEALCDCVWVTEEDGVCVCVAEPVSEPVSDGVAEGVSVALGVTEGVAESVSDAVPVTLAVDDRVAVWD